jgi:hypothetical protein
MKTMLLLVINSVAFRDVGGGGCVFVMKEQCGACSNFLLRSPGNLHNWSQWCGELMDCSVTVFIDEFSKFFNVLCRFAGTWLPWRLSSSTDTQLALNRECHSETAVRLKESSPKASLSISRVSVADLPSFTQTWFQTHCSILPSIADKTKYEVEKAPV